MAKSVLGQKLRPSLENAPPVVLFVLDMGLILREANHDPDLLPYVDGIQLAIELLACRMLGREYPADPPIDLPGWAKDFIAKAEGK